jgi:methylglyoxal synthase
VIRERFKLRYYSRETGDDMKKSIALVAHDNKKEDLVEWVDFNKGTLALHNLYATGHTGRKIIERTGLNVTLLKDGSLGGDMELGAMISNGRLDYLIFFWDPLTPLPHDVDVKALLRIAVLYNIPTACNRATADLIISSPLFHTEQYKPTQGRGTD